MPENLHPDFEPANDFEMIQSMLVAAAIQGDTTVRSQLRRLQEAFDEPYRTVAAVLSHKCQTDEFVDKYTLGHHLKAHSLTRRTIDSQVEQLDSQQVVNLLFATGVQPGQIAAYLQIVNEHLAEKKQNELQQRATELAKKFGTNPHRLVVEYTEMVEQSRKDGLCAEEAFPSEILEVIPFAEQLLSEQTGAEFLGLDSGFSHVNSICNGLDTGLSILAAPPGRGKTTWLWQVCCQVARIEKVPVIFVSMEQSKRELRAKVLARTSKIAYRHLLRGRLRSDNSEDRQKLLEALKQYFAISKYLTIIEGDETTTVDSILDVAVAKMTDASRCLIAVDYLQKLPLRSSDVNRITSTKDGIDIKVSTLRRIARKLDSPVITISSENRAGYNSRKLDVFKESGEIEYSADIAMVLTPSMSAETPSNAEYKLLDLNIVKNRNGETGIVKFKFYPQRGEFIELGKEQLPEDSEE